MPRRVRLAGTLVAGCVALAGCSFDRTAAIPCGDVIAPGSSAAVAQSLGGPAASERRTTGGGMLPERGETQARVADAFRREAREQPGPGPVRVPVLILSAGGQYGAFGAGFLSGWSGNPRTPRPDFDLVTGVSAGALLAPVAFAGPAFDAALRPWDGLSGEEVYRQRGIFDILRAPSLATTGPLERLVAGQLSDALIAEMGARNGAGMRVLISAVDLDSSRAQVFDLGAVAASSLSPERKRRCITEAMLASAAIPGLLPPRNIDGRLYADGGLRDQLFLTTLESGRAQVAREEGREILVEARVVLNGALDLPDSALGRPDASGAIRERLPDYVIRATSILADEVLRNSVRRVIDFAEARPLWRLTGMVGPGDVDCGAEETRTGLAGGIATGAFDTCMTAALFEAGRQAGARVPIDWLSPDELAELARSPGAGTE